MNVGLLKELRLEFIFVLAAEIIQGNRLLRKMTSIKSIIDKNLVCVFALASESSLAWDLFNSHQNSGSGQGVPVFLCYQLQHAIEISQVFPQLSNNLSSSLLLAVSNS